MRRRSSSSSNPRSGSSSSARSDGPLCGRCHSCSGCPLSRCCSSCWERAATHSGDYILNSRRMLARAMRVLKKVESEDEEEGQQQQQGPQRQQQQQQPQLQQQP